MTTFLVIGLGSRGRKQIRTVKYDGEKIPLKKNEKLEGVIGHGKEGLLPDEAKGIFRRRRSLSDLSSLYVELPHVKLPRFDVSPIKIPEMIPEMVTIPAGKFTMGTTKYENEQPVREVTISRPFALGKYEVTNGEYKVYLEATGQKVPDLVADTTKDRHPVVRVTWEDAVTYCEWLSETTGRKFRLPTEAEWEYAERGTDRKDCTWKGVLDPLRLTLHHIGETRPVTDTDGVNSPFGTKDQAGNVWEWVEDWYQANYKCRPKDLVDPKGPQSGRYKVLRGGPWHYTSDRLYGSCRNKNYPDAQLNFIGFRLAEDIS